MELIRNIHCILAGHAVGYQENLVRFDQRLDLLKFVHQLVIDMQPSGGIENDDIDKMLLRIVYGCFADLGGLAPSKKKCSTAIESASTFNCLTAAGR